MTDGELGLRGNDSKLLLPPKRTLPLHVPAVVEFTLVAVSPLLRDVMRGMRCAWREVNEESRTKNADPERLKRIFESQMRSPDRMRYALLEVMTFGWSNCANELIEYVVHDETPPEEYKKLFTKVRTIKCDEP